MTIKTVLSILTSLDGELIIGASVRDSDGGMEYTDLQGIEVLYDANGKPEKVTLVIIP
jgi:hypothetical protein